MTKCTDMEPSHGPTERYTKASTHKTKNKAKEGSVMEMAPTMKETGIKVGNMEKGNLKEMMGRCIRVIFNLASLKPEFCKYFSLC